MQVWGIPVKLAGLLRLGQQVTRRQAHTSGRYLYHVPGFTSNVHERVWSRRECHVRGDEEVNSG